MREMLERDFFARPTLTVARELVGKYLVRRVDGKTRAYRITETEAYFGYRDKGSHAHRGKTARNTPMFAEPGTIYVYFTYGMHWMLNLVCDKADFPAAVLIRGVEPDGVRLDGPARVTKHLRIDKSLNGLPLGKKTSLWVEDRGEKIAAKHIARTPRVGIPNRGVWTDKPWRFILKDARAIEPPGSSRRSYRGRTHRSS